MDYKNHILIDGGYFFFYRFHATKLWFNKSHSEMQIDDLSENEDFINMFIKRTSGTINELSKKFRCKTSEIIFASDCARSNIWRNTSNIIDNYKGNRKKTVGIGKMIKIGYNTLHEMKNPPKIINCFNAEADDIIAVISKKINSDFPNDYVKIITSDKDLEQLCNEKTVIHHLKNKFPLAECKYNPKISLMIKIIGGDKSDNIPPIAPKIGKKNIIELASSSELLNDYLKKSSDEVRNNYETNNKMIDLSMIPHEIKDNIIDKYQYHTI
jgi:5'-3' exonuclease